MTDPSSLSCAFPCSGLSRRLLNLHPLVSLGFLPIPVAFRPTDFPSTHLSPRLEYHCPFATGSPSRPFPRGELCFQSLSLLHLQAGSTASAAKRRTECSSSKGAPARSKWAMSSMQALFSSSFSPPTVQFPPFTFHPSYPSPTRREGPLPVPS